MTGLNDILLKSMTNSWIKQAYIKVSYFEYINFKSTFNMLERMEISEYIYEGVVVESKKDSFL